MNENSTVDWKDCISYRFECMHLYYEHGEGH